MIEEQRSISFICLANYCRSPVAKVLLENRFKNALKVDSAGINPMISAGMDIRSVNYLRENNYTNEIHNPKKINRVFLNSSDIVFAMDTFVLMHLNKTYKNYRHKFKLFTYKKRNIQIKDPYRLSEKEYKNVMDKIKFVVDSFQLEELS
tara:strand:- start:169 stop:615 length:447 start_codon:yes stop_codon:yes gene_type:complete